MVNSEENAITSFFFTKYENYWPTDMVFHPLDVTEILCNLELCIQRVKVMPTPDGRALDLFFVTDGM